MPSTRIDAFVKKLGRDVTILVTRRFVHSLVYLDIRVAIRYFSCFSMRASSLLDDAHELQISPFFGTLRISLAEATCCRPAGLSDGVIRTKER